MHIFNRGNKYMIIQDIKDIELTGWMVFLYSESGVGKTASTLISAPDPIIHLPIEPRSLKPTLDVVREVRPDLKYKRVIPEKFEELYEFLSDFDSKLINGARTIFVDSYTHVMNIFLAGEIEDEAFEARTDEEKRKKSLVNQTKMSQEGYGGLSSHMFRLTTLLGKWSQRGKVVVCTALLQENPKWNRTLAAAPALKGKEFPTSMKGYFDLIGLVTNRIDKEGNIVYPPFVQFESPEDDFVAKYTGKKKNGKPAAGPLDLSKILRVKQ